VCLSVYRAITKAVKENVEQAVRAEKDRILAELATMFDSRR
jgi:predicted proteasome-type protease